MVALAFVLILTTAGAAVDLARAGTIPASDVARVRAQAHAAAELVHSASAASTPAAARLPISVTRTVTPTCRPRPAR